MRLGLLVVKVCSLECLLIGEEVMDMGFGDHVSK